MGAVGPNFPMDLGAFDPANYIFQAQGVPATGD